MPDINFELLAKDIAYLPKDQQVRVRQAFDCALQAHGDQLRRSGDLYITHPIAVAQILASMKMDVSSIMAGLLHDVVEDTHVSLEELASVFGDEVAYIVDGVSKITRIKFRNKIEEQAENFRKMLLAMSKDIRVIIIKLADRLHNMLTIDSMPLHKQKFKAYETLEIYAPIAKRLGMHHICLELENVGFKTLYPMRYRVLSHQLEQVQIRNDKALAEIKAAIEQKLATFEMSPAWIKTRGKHIYSVYKKIKKTHLSFSKLTDVFGVRIALETVEQCYLTLGIVHMTYRPMSRRFKDYIAIPKANGYQSLHTVLFGPSGMPIEVQIRTTAMDQLAEQGVAAHWLYKVGQSRSVLDINKQQWLKNLIELQQQTGSSVEFLENVKTDIFSDSVYVFTTKGEVIEMPAGSTILDFAFEISEDVGCHCVAAKVDRDFSPLSSTCQTGQVIEIITAPNAEPSRSWLNIVKSTKARAVLKALFAQQKRSESVALGKKLFIKAMNDLSIDSTAIDMTKIYTCLPQQHGKITEDDFFELVGTGQISSTAVCQLYVDSHGLDHSDMQMSALAITGAEGMAIEYGSCCRAIPGDQIVGIIKSGSGVIIHRAPCARARRVLRSQGFQEIPVCWSDHVSGEYETILRIEAINQRGVLAAIVVTISDFCQSIEDVFIDSYTSDSAVVKVKMSVTGRTQLSQIMRQLRRLRQVLNVKRNVEEEL